jgi:hypothetical protein
MNIELSSVKCKETQAAIWKMVWEQIEKYGGNVPEHLHIKLIGKVP